MLKKNKGYIIITTLIVLLPMLVGVILWDRLPEQMATHFNVQGEADGWSSKTFAVFGLPLFLAAIHGIGVAATCMDPRKQNIQNKIFRMVLWITPGISLFVMGITYLYGLGFDVNITRMSLILMAVVFIVVGNYLPKCRQNYTVGIKVPWTLADAENWNQTHRFAGWLWTIAGIVFLLMALMGFVNFTVMMGMILTAALVPVGYSYVFYVKCKKE